MPPRSEPRPAGSGVVREWAGCFFGDPESQGGQLCCPPTALRPVRSGQRSRPAGRQVARPVPAGQAGPGRLGRAGRAGSRPTPKSCLSRACRGAGSRVAPGARIAEQGRVNGRQWGPSPIPVPASWDARPPTATVEIGDCPYLPIKRDPVRYGIMRTTRTEARRMCLT